MDISSLSRLVTPQTMETVSGGLQSVSEGIQANPAGLAGLDDAIQSFSPDPSSFDPAASGPTGSAADIAPPLDYMKLLPSGGESLVSQHDVMQALQDPSFDPGKAITDCGNNMFSGEGIVANIMGDNGPFAEALGGVQLPPPNDPAVASQPNTNRGIIIVDFQSPTEDGGERGVVTDLKSNALTDMGTGDPVAEDGPGQGGIKTANPKLDYQAQTENSSERGIVTDLKSNALTDVGTGDPVAEDGPGQGGIKTANPKLDYQAQTENSSERGVVTDLKSNALTDPGTGDPVADDGPGQSGIKTANPNFAYQDSSTPGSAPPSFSGLMTNIARLDPFSEEGQSTLQTLHDQLQTFENMQSTVQEQISLQQRVRNSIG